MKRLIAVPVIVAALMGSALVAIGQTPATGRMMREKLAHAQRLLEAITTSNYKLLEHESVALSRLTETPRWEDLKTPEFRGYSDDFLKAILDLTEAAKARDLDAAAVHYGSLVAACYRCHRHVKDARIAR